MNNQLVSTSASIYRNSTITCTTADQVNALPNMTVSGTLVGA